MKITVNEDRSLQIEEAYVGPVFKTSDGETLGVCMRDSGFEITYKAPGSTERWFSLQNGKLEEMGVNESQPKRESDPAEIPHANTPQ